MRIGIDARFYGPDSKGLGRYTEQLIKNLEKSDTKNTYVIFLRAKEYHTYTPRNKNFTKVCADFRWYSFAEQIFFPFVLRAARCDVVHFPHFNVPFFYKKKFVVTIHDLILLRYPTIRATTLHPILYWIKFAAYKLVIRRAIHAAQHIIAVSDFTRKDILRHYTKINPSKVIVTYEAACDAIQLSSREADEIISNYAIIKPYILYAGNAYPHKNLESLVRAFIASDVAQTHELILVGKNDFFYRRLMREVGAHGYSEKIRMLPSVPDVVLNVLYSRAVAFIFPSLYEGFGLPPLEAMLHGCPVATSDATCLPEIVGDAALLFDAKKQEDITRAIERIVSDRELRERLIREGRQHALTYSWHRMAQETCAVYEKIKKSHKLV